MIMIVGASGALGSRVVRRALDAGASVRALSRQPDRLTDAVARGAEVVRGDLLETHWMAGALAGVERLVIAAHALVPPSRRNTPQAVDGDGARRLIDAAAATGVRQIVYLSVAGAETEATAFGRIKRATERHLEASGVPWTVIRPSVFVENHALVLLGAPARAGKPVPFFGPGAERINWVAADDVADDVVACCGDAGTLGTVREIRGPDRLSRREALAIVENELGVQARRQHLPVGMVKVLRAATRRLHPGLHALLDLSLHEIERGGDPEDEPERATWVGPTSVVDVVRAWARAGTVATA